MKKLFTLVALLTCFLGAKAEVEKVYEVDYSKYTGFPFYVMGYVPEWINGVMTDMGNAYSCVTVEGAEETSEVIVKTNSGVEYYRLEKGGFHQYFIADNIPTELDGNYIVKALVKASETVTFNVNMGWGWGSGEQIGADVTIPASDDFIEVEWEYSGIGGASCNLVAQPQVAATIEWKSLAVYTDRGDAVPVTWLQMLTDTGNAAEPEGDGKYVGDAEFGAWPSWSLETTDGINANWRGNDAGKICAWALTMGRNFDDQNTVISEDSPRSRPFPADIEAEEGNASNHVFAVHVDQIAAIEAPTPDENSIQWSNQFWIQSPKGWKTGTKVRIKFRYKAQHACNVGTQIHKEHPSDYLHWNAVGDVAFATDWQEFEKTIEFDASQGGGWSLAFNLCSDADNGRTPNVFYFDDLSWEVLKLDEGLFVASKGNDFNYDYAQAPQFEYDSEAEAYVATVGTVGKPETWVNEVQISTIRGDKSAFLGATLKPTSTVTLDAEGFSDWIDYTESSQAKIKLPLGVYRILVDLDESHQMQFQQLEGEAAAEPVDIVTNTEEFVVNATERDWRGTDNDGNPIEAEVGSGQPWDNQFWIAANRDLSTGEVTVLKFKYKANKAARTSTQAHKVGDDGKPCTYLNWQAIGDVNFTEDWQDFSTDFTVPEGDNGMRSFVFNMAEIKEACDYYIKDVQWYVKDEALEAEGKTMENLINETGRDNFWIKVNSGQPESAGIESVVFNKTVSNVTYNLAGQRVNKGFKGIVVKNGKKAVVK